MSGNALMLRNTAIGALVAAAIGVGVCIGGVVFIEKPSEYKSQAITEVVDRNTSSSSGKEARCTDLMSVAVEGMFNRQYTKKPAAAVGERFAQAGDLDAYNIILDSYRGEIVLGEKQKDDFIMNYAMYKYAECMGK